ncbi:RDD family protein [Castellaniella sp.]|uniref:RDD family protein n=1 Tax=Castellaniella sp. TaxID=1955812 RepID=UPI002AFFDD3A|nr:RDD family protein [Castellaniella sp.]
MPATIAQSELPSTPPIAPSRLRRFACMMYEGVLLFGVIFLAGYLFDTLTQSRSGLMLRHSRQVFLFLAMGVYFLACWRRGGQTLPMKTWNIRLTDRGGQPLRGSRMVVRYVLLWPLPLLTALLIGALSRAMGWPSLDLLIVAAPFSIFIWTWFDPHKQFLHDRLLGTELHDLRQPA